MEWVLQRSYYAWGTNGALFVNGRFICFTIELPWRENRRNVSCIPEGRYELQPRISKKFGNYDAFLSKEMDYDALSYIYSKERR